MTVGTLMLGAARVRAEAEAWSGQQTTALEKMQADKLEARARELIPQQLREYGAGGELVPNKLAGVPAAEFRSTVAKPDYVAAAASRERLDLVHDAGALELALDIADTVDAKNSIEQMLAHQLAAAHKSSMALAVQLNRAVERMSVFKDEPRALANVEATRLAGSIARLMQTCQNGALTLQRLRTGGAQTITVRNVNVAAGGQAVVTGQVTTGGRADDIRGEGSKNEQ